MMMKKPLVGGLLLVLALATAGVLPPKDGDPGATTGASVVANDLPPDNTQTKH